MLKLVVLLLPVLVSSLKLSFFNSSRKLKILLFLSDPSPIIIVYPCNWVTPVIKTWLMWPWRVKIPTQNLLRVLLLLKFVMRMVGNNLLQIWKRGLVIKLNFCSDFEHFGLDFEVEAQARFWSWSLVSILLMMFGLGYEVELSLVQYSEARFGRDLVQMLMFDVFIKILKLMLNRDSEIVICSRFVNCDLVIWTQPSGPLCLWQCFHSLPVHEFWEWFFFITFPFPNFGKWIFHSHSCSWPPKSHSCSPLLKIF